MATISRAKIWVPGDILTSSDLNGEFNIAFNEINGNLDSDNIGTLETLTFVNNTATSTISINASGGTGAAWEVIA